MVRVASVSSRLSANLLLAGPKSFSEARTRRLSISSNPSQYDNVDIFIREQEIFQQLVQDSVLPKLLVDVTERSLEQQIDYIADWLEATGALIQQKRHQIVKLCYALILQ
jgi:hypothetical protein